MLASTFNTDVFRIFAIAKSILLDNVGMGSIITNTASLIHVRTHKNSIILKIKNKIKRVLS